MVQYQSFHSEIDASMSTKDISLPKSRSLYQVDPFRLLRVGGRLRKSKLNKDKVHPVLLPKKNEITNAVVQWCLKAVAHGRRGLILNQFQQSGFCVIHGHKICISIIYHCVISHKLQGKLRTQKMADLPMDRLTETPPFTYLHCGHVWSIHDQREATINQKIWDFVHFSKQYANPFRSGKFHGYQLIHTRITEIHCSQRKCRIHKIWQWQ